MPISMPTMVPSVWSSTARRLSRPLALGLLSSGCAGAPVSACRTESHATAQAEATLARWLHDGQEVGFSYAVVSETRVLAEIAVGRRDAGKVGGISSSTTFLSASVTKLLTALAILRLADEGRVKLDDPLAKYAPWHPYGLTVTLRNLLNHTAGIPNPWPLTWLHLREQHPEFQEQDAMRAAIANHPVAAAGGSYEYSNLGYWLLGAVIDRASGQAYDHFVQGQLLSPLGIGPTEVGFEVPDWENHARGHVRRWSWLGALVPFVTQSEHRARSSAGWWRFADLYMNGRAYGGAIASARGYARLLQDLVGDHSRIISDESLALLYREGGEPDRTLVGLQRGQLAGVSYASKPGGGPGYSANVRLYRDLGLGTIFLSNRMRATEREIQGVSDALDRAFVEARLYALGQEPSNHLAEGGDVHPLSVEPTVRGLGR